jgi:crossover junction endodeoxyribonuclease RuvC
VRVLGIDPGSTRTGFGVLDEDGGREPSLVGAGVIQAGRGSMPARLARILDGLERVLREFRPAEVAMEEVFHARNARSALVLGQARGVALAVAGRAGLPVHEYAPSRIKQTVAGHGAADKESVRRVLELCLGEAPAAPDASDAVAIALCHLRWRGCAAGRSRRA